MLSAAMSVDGCIDDTSPQRLILSDEADFARVDGLRSASGAILVGATTLRRDDPRLLASAGAPLKVVVTGSGELDSEARFFTTGTAAKIVYAVDVARARVRVGHVADVVAAGDPLDLGVVLADLLARGVEQVLVEGGTSVHTQFLAAGVVDELHLAVAPIFVGDAGAPRFVGPGPLPPRMRLAGVSSSGDIVVLRYLLGADDG